MEGKISTAIEGHIVRAFETSREWGADIFGIGLEFQRRMPAYWKELEGDWDIFVREMELEVSVAGKIRQFGLLEEPPFFEYHVTE